MSVKPSPLHSPINCLRLSDDAKKIAVGGSDGRLHLTKIFYKQGQNDFSVDDVVLFKAQKDEGKDKMQNLFAINSIGFNCRDAKWLYSAGGDGGINFWESVERARILQINVGTAVKQISAADVSMNGQLLAYAIGYDWGKGVWGLDQIYYKPQVYCHVIQQNECVYNKSVQSVNGYIR